MDNLELADLLDSFSRAYPEDVFPPLTEDERKALPRGIIDRCSGAMGRHFAKFATQAAAALRESEELRRDAERYRWLTKHAYVGETYTHEGTVFEVHGCDREVPIDDDVDAAIDAAIDSARGADKTEREAG